MTEPKLFGFGVNTDDGKDRPIEYTHHVIVGNNPDNEGGHWDTEHEAAWFFAKHMEEVLKNAQGKLLFVRRTPVLESNQLFERDKPVYRMIGRFSIGQLKANYAAQELVNPKREWVGLTMEEIDLLEELYAPPVHPDFANDASHCLELIRHVEAKLKEKNT